MFARGVPTDVVWLEERATNTAENITNTKAMLSEVGVRIGRGVACHEAVHGAAHAGDCQ